MISSPWYYYIPLQPSPTSFSHRVYILVAKLGLLYVYPVLCNCTGYVWVRLIYITCQCCLMTKNQSIVVDRASFDNFIQQNCVQKTKDGRCHAVCNHAKRDLCTMLKLNHGLHKSKLCTFCTDCAIRGSMLCADNPWIALCFPDPGIALAMRRRSF